MFFFLFPFFLFDLHKDKLYTMGAKELLTARVFVHGKIAFAVQGIALLFQIQYYFDNEGDNNDLSAHRLELLE